jgi:ABC-type multidrug transport system fused ATPase/permease subunit
MREENDMDGFDALRLGLIGAIIMALLLFVLRFLAPFRFAILAFLLVLVVAYGAWRLRKYWRARRAAKAFATTRRGQIQQQLTRSRAALRAHEAAIAQLRKSQGDLRQSQAATKEESTGVQAKAMQLLQGYTDEITLRQQKVEFYQQTIKELEKLDAHHHWLETLQEKEAELAHYRKQHAGEAAELESLRWTLEREGAWLQTVDHLSDRLEAADSLESIVEMRESIKELLV